MEVAKVIVLPEVWELLETLPITLLDRGYKINQEFADNYVDEIVDFIYKIPFEQSHKIAPQFDFHFKRYGDNLQYAFWKRGNTTWYFFFQQQDDTFLVRHISNNWTEGQYIR